MKGIVTFRKFTNAPKSALLDLWVHGFDTAVDQSCHCHNFRSNRTQFVWLFVISFHLRCLVSSEALHRRTWTFGKVLVMQRTVIFIGC